MRSAIPSCWRRISSISCASGSPARASARCSAARSRAKPSPTLWSETSRKAIDDLLAIVTDETTGAVAGLTGRTDDGAETDLELLLLPLAHIGHARIRALGVLAPTIPPYWIGDKPVVELTLGTLRHIGADADSRIAPRLVPATDGGRVRHGFVVYSGGRETPVRRADRLTPR